VSAAPICPLWGRMLSLLVKSSHATLHLPLLQSCVLVQQQEAAEQGGGFDPRGWETEGRPVFSPALFHNPAEILTYTKDLKQKSY